MTDETPATNRGMDRRALLRNGLLTGVGITVAGLAVTSPAHATAPGRSPATTDTASVGARPAGAAADAGYQEGWRYCSKCEGLFYGEFQGSSNCPTGGNHNGAGSYNYGLLHDFMPYPEEQAGWRYCSKCEGLFYGEFQGTSNCPTGGNHNGAGSHNYLLSHDIPVVSGFQGGWRYCSKCEGLFYGEFQGSSNCPTGGNHNGAGSYNYVLSYL